MKKILCAFSSNFRPLYIGDVYKVLSMPKGYIVHFRYKKKYIENEIFDNYNKYIGKEIVIFFTDIDKKTNIARENYPVRSAKLKLFEYIEETELVHIYMELQDFVNISLASNINTEKLPSTKYFSELEYTTLEENLSWKTKIEQLKDFFPNLSFYYLKKINKSSGKEVKIKTRKDKKSTYYNLNHGNKYFLDISIGNPKENDSQISLFSSSDDISFNISNPISVTVHYDDLIVPMYLKSLNVSSESSFLSFSPEITDEDKKSEFIKEYASNIEVIKKVSKQNSLKFGLASVIAVLSIWSIKDNSGSLNYISCKLPFDWKLIISCIFLVLSSSYLFFKFNKK